MWFDLVLHNGSVAHSSHYPITPPSFAIYLVDLSKEEPVVETPLTVLAARVPPYSSNPTSYLPLLEFDLVLHSPLTSPTNPFFSSPLIISHVRPSP
jgi:hypothetical protein